MDRKALYDNVPKDADLVVCLLGGFNVRVAGEWLVGARWKLRKARQLMILLALAPNQRLHREELIEWLWPDFDPAAADNNLRRTLFETRRTLAPAPAPFDTYVRLDGTDVCLANDSIWIDTIAFESAVAEAEREQTAEAFGRAIALYGGDLAPQERYTEGLNTRREHLRSAFLKLWFDLAELHEKRAEPLHSIQAYKEVLDIDPDHEDVHARLMRLYALTGQRHLALRQYRTLEEVLRKELDVDPSPATQQIYEQILKGKLASGPVTSDNRPAPLASPQRVDVPRSGPVHPVPQPHNLPTPLTPFIAGQGALATVVTVVKSRRIVTLTGMGGAGKSRLALEVALRIGHQYEDGAWLIDLSETTDAASVQKVIGAALGAEMGDLPDNDPYSHATCSKHQLVILDNCEHVAGPCREFIERMLLLHPQTHLLVTSRHALDLQGEVVWPVPPLDTPDIDCDLSPKELQKQYGAVKLFMQQAAFARLDFQLTNQNVAEVISICRQLDGNPLALQLAAARLRILSPGQIAALLSEPFALLKSDDRNGPPRHRTLQAAIDGSYSLLTPQLQELFDALSVFEGQFTLEEAASAVGGGATSHGLLIRVLDDLSSLVGQSLITVEELDRGMTKYHMPNILRHYARSRQAQRGEGIPMPRLLNPTG